MNVVCKLFLIFASWRIIRRRHDIRKRLAFSIARTSTTLMNNWKSKGVLPFVLIVMAHAIYIIQGCELFTNLLFGQSKAYR